jgi:hypothetical protein
MVFNLCFYRLKGTEHLQQESLRKCNESSVEHSQRYIKLPTSSSVSKISDSAVNKQQQRSRTTTSTTTSSASKSMITENRDLSSTVCSNNSNGNNKRNTNSIRMSNHLPVGSVSASSSSSSSIASPNCSKGTFINKPSRGWLHPDHQIAETGVLYAVRYIGCLGINTSMKSLDFDTRSQIAKECINKVCESGGLKTADKKRRTEKRIIRMLAETPNMEFAGSNVNLNITSSYLNLTIMETDEIVAKHDMPNISFASVGDAVSYH